MKVITQEQMDIMSYYQPALTGKGKSQLRLDIEALNVGEIALFKNSGHDYHKFMQLYSAVGAVRKEYGRTFELKQLASKDGAVVKRTA
jgi:hypothetical protein